MKKAKITPLGAGQNDRILINAEQYSDSTRIELICNYCHTSTLVTITDKAGNSDLFCRQCAAVYNQNDDTVRRKQRLSVPLETEPAVATTPGQEYLNKSVEIHHEPELKGAFKALRDRGIKITYYEERIPK
jgi:hypothetical protein